MCRRAIQCVPLEYLFGPLPSQQKALGLAGPFDSEEFYWKNVEMTLTTLIFICGAPARQKM
jgi:hypothetical protein